MSERRVKPTGKMKSLAEAKKAKGVLIPELRKVALATAGDGHPGGSGHIHPSEMAKADWCPRATYYRIKTGVEHTGTFSFVLESIFDEGNDIHAKWQRRMRQTKKLWGSWKCLICKQWSEVGWEPSPVAGRCLVDQIQHIWEYAELTLTSKEDLIWGHEDGGMMDRTPPEISLSDGQPSYMVEIKSIGLGTVRIDAPEILKRCYVETVDGDMVYNLDKLWKDLARPFGSHVRQANVYLWLAEKMGLPFKSVRFLYEFKANQQTKEFVITKSDDILEPLLTKAADIRYALKKGKPPACPQDGCKYCEAYEAKSGEKNGGTEAGTEAGTGPVPSGGVRRRRTEVTGAGDRHPPVDTPSRRRTASGRATGPDGDARPAADEPVSRRRTVAPVPDPPAGGSRSRRVVRRESLNKDRGC